MRSQKLVDVTSDTGEGGETRSIRPPTMARCCSETILALAAVCLLAFIVLKWGLKRLYGGYGAQDDMTIVSRVCDWVPSESCWSRVSARSHLILGSTEQQFSVLGELSAEEAADYFERQAAGEETDG